MPPPMPLSSAGAWYSVGSQSGSARSSAKGGLISSHAASADEAPATADSTLATKALTTGVSSTNSPRSPCIWFIARATYAKGAMGRFDDVYRQSLEDPEGFWTNAAAAIEWDTPWERVLDDSRAPFYRWFTGGRLNSCHNALDRHVEGGRADQAALVYDSPVTGTTATYTYRELRDAVARFAGALAAQGVGRGDRVIVYMPMVPEAVIAMLASARIGAVHSVVFGGFASHELASRIEDAKPKVIVSASCG